MMATLGSVEIPAKRVAPASPVSPDAPALRATLCSNWTASPALRATAATPVARALRACKDPPDHSVTTALSACPVPRAAREIKGIQEPQEKQASPVSTKSISGETRVTPGCPADPDCRAIPVLWETVAKTVSWRVTDSLPGVPLAARGPRALRVMLDLAASLDWMEQRETKVRLAIPERLGREVYLAHAERRATSGSPV